jgi:arginine N-succinyltransferase
MMIRPVAISDLPDLKAIAIESGPGFTSLANDHNFLVQKIERSIASFAGAAGSHTRPHNDQGYLFVLVDPDTGNIMGTTGIEASVGTRRPLYHYRVEHAGRRQQTLSLCNHYKGCSEICTLYLRPCYRRAWAGKLLSRVRFLFMAQHPDRFARTVIAEMRGVSDVADGAPFWRWLQANFVDLDFATVSQRAGTGDNGFIADLMPEHRLYSRLMDESARAVIGKVHPDTRPALHMLESEGFRFTGFVDPFDGGPTVEARVQSLRSVRQSRHCRARIGPDKATSESAWTNGGQGKTLLVANNKLADFRATVTSAARYLPAHQLLEIPESLARSLGIETDHNGNADVWFADLEAGSQQNRNPALTATHHSNRIKEALGAN